MSICINGKLNLAQDICRSSKTLYIITLAYIIFFMKGMILFTVCFWVFLYYSLCSARLQ